MHGLLVMRVGGVRHGGHATYRKSCRRAWTSAPERISWQGLSRATRPGGAEELHPSREQSHRSGGLDDLLEVQGGAGGPRSREEQGAGLTLVAAAAPAEDDTQTAAIPPAEARGMELPSAP